MSSERQYEDLKLRIDGEGPTYRVEVLESPAGETVEPVTVVWVSDAHVRASAGSSRDLDAEGPDLAEPRRHSSRELGSRLFEAFFGGRVGELFRESRLILGESKGLRLKLQIEPPELSATPWEVLYDTREKRFVALSSKTPVVRHIRLPTALLPLTVEPPLRVLGMVAHPSTPGLAVLDVEGERELINSALSELVEKGVVDLRWTERGTLDALRQMLWDGPWHVFHFIGHGSFDEQEGRGYLVLEDPDSKPARLYADDLATLLRDEADVRLAVLNACKGATASRSQRLSGTAATLMERGMGGVVAMQNPIGDAAATTFAKVLYTALGRGMPLDAAVASGRVAIKLEELSSEEWWTPVLHLRSEDGRLFKTGAVQQTELGRFIEAGLDEHLETALGRRRRKQRVAAALLLLAIPVVVVLAMLRRPVLPVTASLATSGVHYRLAAPGEFISDIPSLLGLTVSNFTTYRPAGEILRTQVAPGATATWLRVPGADGHISLEVAEELTTGTEVGFIRGEATSWYEIGIASPQGWTANVTTDGTLNTELPGDSEPTLPLLTGSYSLTAAPSQRLELEAEFADSVRFGSARVDSMVLRTERGRSRALESTVLSGSFVFPEHWRRTRPIGSEPVWFHSLCKGSRPTGPAGRPAGVEAEAEASRPPPTCTLDSMTVTADGVSFRLRGIVDSVGIGDRTVHPARLLEWSIREQLLYVLLALLVWGGLLAAVLVSMDKVYVTLPE